MRETRESIKQMKIQLINEGYSEQEAFYQIVEVCKSQLKNDFDRMEPNTESWVWDKINPQFLKQEDSLSWIYEYYVSDSEEREKRGIYYTPSWIVKYMVEEAWNALRKANPSLRIEGIRIIDPACGTGNFLLGIVDCLWQAYKTIGTYGDEEIVDHIVNQVWGCDIDEDALAVCKMNLERKLSQLAGCAVVRESWHLYCEDFLLVFDREKFHLALGNPPYLENRKVNKYYDKKEFQGRFTTARGRFDLFNLFIEKGLKIIVEGAILAFIIPNSILYNNNFEYIRRLILEKTKILNILDLGEGIFEGVGLGMAILTVEKCSRAAMEHKILIGDLGAAKDKRSALKGVSLQSIPQHYYQHSLKSVFDIHSHESVFEFRNRMMAIQKKVQDYCEVIAGVATGNIRNKLVLKERVDKNCFRVLEGKNVDRYALVWGQKYIHYNRNIINREAGEYATFMRQEFIDEPKILIRQTADEVIATLDEEGYYLLNTLYSLVVREPELSIQYVLALLNSKLVSFLYHSLVREKGKIFPQLKIFHVKNIPVMIPTHSVQEKIRNKVDQLLWLRKKADSEENQMIYEKLIQEIDEEIYSIYQLSPREMELVDGFPRRKIQRKNR